MTERFLTIEEIKAIPPDQYPFLVFSDNPRSLFGWGIKVRTKGVYDHFMWLIGPDLLASQRWWFQKRTVDSYSGYTLKLVNNPDWTPAEKTMLIGAIMADVNKPWYRTLYDVPGILGQAVGIPEINIPWLDYCSERGSYLKLVDPEYNLKHPDPVELNRWTKERPDKYKVYGRYAPE